MFGILFLLIRILFLLLIFLFIAAICTTFIKFIKFFFHNNSNSRMDDTARAVIDIMKATEELEKLKTLNWKCKSCGAENHNRVVCEFCGSGNR